MGIIVHTRTEIWEEHMRKKDIRIVSVVTRKEAAALDRAAQKAGHSRSFFVRNAILRQSGMGLVKGKPPRAGWCPRRLRRVLDE